MRWLLCDLFFFSRSLFRGLFGSLVFRGIKSGYAGTLTEVFGRLIIRLCAILWFCLVFFRILFLVLLDCAFTTLIVIFVKLLLKFDLLFCGFPLFLSLYLLFFLILWSNIDRCSSSISLLHSFVLRSVEIWVETVLATIGGLIGVEILVVLIRKGAHPRFLLSFNDPGFVDLGTSEKLSSNATPEIIILFEGLAYELIHALSSIRSSTEVLSKRHHACNTAFTLFLRWFFRWFHLCFSKYI